MADNRLYNLAFAFKNSKLWNKLNDDDLFAVRLPDGEIGYCSVMGMAGEHYALAVYPGDAGFQSFHRLYDLDIDSAVDQGEFLAAQNCLMCSFENKELLSDEELKETRAYAASVGKRLCGRNAFPKFWKYRTGRYPWHLETEQDTARMEEALQAALHVDQLLKELGWSFWVPTNQGSQKLPLIHQSDEADSFTQLSLFGDDVGGFPPKEERPEPTVSQHALDNLAPYLTSKLPLLERNGEEWSVQYIQMPSPYPVWPTPVFSNEILMERLRRAKKTGVWECGTMYAPTPIQLDDEDQEAPYYPLLLISVKHANGTRIDPLVMSETGDSEKMLADFASSLLEAGCPRKILFGDDRCYALLADFCQKIGVELDQQSAPRYLLEAMEDIADMNTEEDMDGSDKIAELTEMLMELPDEGLQQMPPYLLRELNRLAEAEMLPDELVERLSRLKKR